MSDRERIFLCQAGGHDILCDLEIGLDAIPQQRVRPSISSGERKRRMLQLHDGDEMIVVVVDIFHHRVPRQISLSELRDVVETSVLDGCAYANYGWLTTCQKVGDGAEEEAMTCAIHQMASFLQEYGTEIMGGIPSI